MTTDNDIAYISGDFLRIDEAPKVFAGEDDPADVASDANATGDTMAGDPMRGVQPDTSMHFGGTPDDQDSFRTASGHTGFLDRVFHEQDRHRGADSLPPDIAAGVPKRLRRVDVNGFARAAQKIKTSTFVLGAIPNSQRIAVERETRRRLVIANFDTTGPLYVSSDGGVAIGSPDAIRVPPASVGISGNSTIAATRAATVGLSLPLTPSTLIEGFDFSIGVGSGAYEGDIAFNLNGWPGNSPTFHIVGSGTVGDRVSVRFPTPIPLGAGASNVAIPALASGGAWDIVVYLRTQNAIPSYRELQTASEVWVAGNAGATFDILDEFDAA